MHHAHEDYRCTPGIFTKRLPKEWKEILAKKGASSARAQALRVHCNTCHVEYLVTFSCKRRGFCLSCGALHMASRWNRFCLMRQWVVSVSFPLKFLFASQPKVIGKVLGGVYRARPRSIPASNDYLTSLNRTFTEIWWMTSFGRLCSLPASSITAFRDALKGRLPKHSGPSDAGYMSDH